MKSEFQTNDLFLLPLPKQIPEHQGRMTVVLDMDETLIHSVFLKEMEELLCQKYERGGYKVKNSLEKLEKTADLFLQQKDYGDIAVFFRPGVHRFLYKLSKKFEVILWTAASRSYAKPILDFLDPKGNLLPYRLFREHTVNKGKIKCAKDLELLGRDMRKVMLIDNCLTAVDTSPKNCYLIQDFYGDPSDQELQKAWLFIAEICDLTDIREHLIMMMNMVKPSKVKKQIKHHNDNQNYDNQNYDNQNYDNQNYDNQNYDNQNYDNQNYDNQNYDNQNYDNKNYDNKNYDDKNYDQDKEIKHHNNNQNYDNKNYDQDKEIKHHNNNQNCDSQNYYDQNYDNQNYYGQNYYGQNYYGQNYYGRNYYDIGYRDQNEQNNNGQNTNNDIDQNNQNNNNNNSNNQEANTEEAERETWDYSYYYWSVAKKKKAFVWKTKRVK